MLLHDAETATISSVAHSSELEPVTAGLGQPLRRAHPNPLSDLQSLDPNWLRLARDLSNRRRSTAACLRPVGREDEVS